MAFCVCFPKRGLEKRTVSHRLKTARRFRYFMNFV